MTQEKAAPKDFLGIRMKREALGLSLKDVFSLTRISVVNLEAIENGDFHDLPVPIYTKNFIKTYARVLDLDSKPILDSYQDYLNAQQIAQIPIPEAVPEKEQEPFSERLPRYKKYVVAAVGAIAVVVVAIIIISQQNQFSPDVPVKPQAIVAPAQPAAAIDASVNLPAPPVTPPQPVAQPVAAPETKQVQTQVLPPKPALPVKQSVVPLPTPAKQNVPTVEKKEPVAISEGANALVIKATEETWLRMKIDENPDFQVLLKPGEQIGRKGTDFKVDIGNAGGITMKFNGKVIENLGNSGQVIHMQFP